MRKILLFLLLLTLSLPLFAQKKREADVVGHVINKATREHLSYVNIMIKGTSIGTITDAQGHYFLKDLPENEYILIASAIGYKTVEQPVSLIAGQTISVDFETEKDPIALNGVVVSANRNEVNRKEAPVVVNTINTKLLENTNAVCLAQGLNYVPGLRVENNCQNCGFQQVRINGLDGPYSQLLIDSRPVFSALAGVYGIEQIPANMIEQVEVIRGGGSALFGANAIAGTINIITKEPSSNSITLANTTNIISGTTTDINTTINASAVTENRKTGIVLFGSSRQRDPYDHNNDGYTEIGKLELKNMGFKGFYKPDNLKKITIEYHNSGEFRRGGNNLDLPPHKTEITEQTEHNINAGSIAFDAFSKNLHHRFNIYSSAQRIDRKSYYGAQQDLNAYGTTNDKMLVTGVQYTYTMDTLLFMPAVLTIGGEYSQNDLLDKMTGYNRTIRQETNTRSVFLQQEWKNKRISLLLGGRLDKHNLINAPIVSPRVNLRYAPKEWISARLSYSSGFRAPQAFDEDLHITAVGGNVALIQLDPDLTTEKSFSYSGSVDLYKTFRNTETNLLIELFYTTLDNVFVLEAIGEDPQGNIILERRNGSGAMVKGFTLEANIAPAKDIQIQCGFTLQKSEYKEVQQWSNNPNVPPHKKMLRSPDRYGYLTAYFGMIQDMNLSVSGIYTGSMLVQHFAGYIPEDSESETPDFLDLNIKLSYDFQLTGTTLQLHGGVQNIFNSFQSDFDRGPLRDAGYIYGPALPRTFFMGMMIKI